jgi:hypothetical protein
MPQRGFEPQIPTPKWEKTFHGSRRTDTVIGRKKRFKEMLTCWMKAADSVQTISAVLCYFSLRRQYFNKEVRLIQLSVGGCQDIIWHNSVLDSYKKWEKMMHRLGGYKLNGFVKRRITSARWTTISRLWLSEGVMRGAVVFTLRARTLEILCASKWFCLPHSQTYPLSSNNMNLAPLIRTAIQIGGVATYHEDQCTVILCLELLQDGT